MQFRGEMADGHCGGKGAIVTETDQHTGAYGENKFPQHLAWKVRGTELYDFWQLAGLKIWSFKDEETWLGQSLEGITLLLKRRQANNPWTHGMKRAI